MIGQAPSPSLRRWRWLARQRTTLLRALENEQIARIRLRGVTLDIGGGASFGYHQLIQIDGSLHSVNISLAERPTIVANLDGPLPIVSECYDHVISFNTFEHLVHDSGAVAEMLRVLRPGGTFHITVPFLYRVHGRYGDFHRHSAQWWHGFIQSLGVGEERFQVVPLVWSPVSSALAQFPWFTGLRLRGRLLRRLVMLVTLGNRSPRAAESAQMALGYYIHGTK